MTTGSSGTSGLLSQGHSGVESSFSSRVSCPDRAKPSHVGIVAIDQNLLVTSSQCTATILIICWSLWVFECAIHGTDGCASGSKIRVRCSQIKIGTGRLWILIFRVLSAPQAHDREQITANSCTAVSLSVKWKQKLLPSLKYGL